MDLSPRDVLVSSDEDGGGSDGNGPRGAGPARRKRKRWPIVVLLVCVIGGGGVIVSKFLTNALDYYCNVDEVNVKPNCNASHSLRVQGIVAKGTITHAGQATNFTMEFNGKSLPVVYEGEPGGLFTECVPVVIRGQLQQGVFVGNDLEVKHSSDYVAANEQRLDDANAEAKACSQP